MLHIIQVGIYTCIYEKRFIIIYLTHLFKLVYVQNILFNKQVYIKHENLYN